MLSLWAFPSTSRAMASLASAVALLGDPLGLGMAYLYTNETIVKEGLLTLQYAYFLFLTGEYDKVAGAGAALASATCVRVFDAGNTRFAKRL